MLSKITTQLNNMAMLGVLNYKLNAPLCNYASFRIGGPADIVVHPKTIEAMVELVKLFDKLEYPFQIYGNASNVLFSDAGYRGAIIFTTEMQECKISGNNVSALSGMSFTLLSSKVRDHSLTGLEFAFGIPGTVGGAIYMNAGAYGGSVSDHLVSSLSYDPVSHTFNDVNNHEFGYRHSCYMGNKNIILSGTFVLDYGNRDTISAKMKELMDSRRSKQPLEYPSAGSVFKRPEGYFAGKLIEDAGLKGFSIGGAQISEKHAGFIINRDHATADDVSRLVEHIQKEVYRQFGVWLETELIRLDQGE